MRLRPLAVGPSEVDVLEHRQRERVERLAAAGRRPSPRPSAVVDVVADAGARAPATRGRLAEPCGRSNPAGPISPPSGNRASHSGGTLDRLGLLAEVVVDEQLVALGVRRSGSGRPAGRRPPCCSRWRSASRRRRSSRRSPSLVVRSTCSSSETSTAIPTSSSVQAVQPVSMNCLGRGSVCGAPRMPIGMPGVCSSTTSWSTKVALTSAPRISWAEVMLMTGISSGGSCSSRMT